MVKRILVIAVCLMVAGTASLALAGDHGTAAEAEALVKKAVAFIKANGKDKAFAEFGNPKGQFTSKDLYIFV